MQGGGVGHLGISRSNTIPTKTHGSWPLGDFGQVHGRSSITNIKKRSLRRAYRSSIFLDTRGTRVNFGKNKLFYPHHLIFNHRPNHHLLHNHLNMFQDIDSLSFIGMEGLSVQQSIMSYCNGLHTNESTLPLSVKLIGPILRNGRPLIGMQCIQAQSPTRRIEPLVC